MIGYNDIRVGEGLEFSDLSDEQVREYIVDGDKITIFNPVALRVSGSGGHYVVDAQENSHYIPARFTHLRWRIIDDAKHVAF